MQLRRSLIFGPHLEAILVLADEVAIDIEPIFAFGLLAVPAPIAMRLHNHGYIIRQRRIAGALVGHLMTTIGAAQRDCISADHRNSNSDSRC